jgi:hypothetical protein
MAQKKMANKLKITFLHSLLFLILFISINYIHNNFFSVNVLLYSSLFDGFISSLITLAVLKNKKINNFEFLLIGSLLLSSTYILSISIPTVIDRSLSFYMLENIHKAGSRIPKNQLDNLIRNEYMNEYKVLDMRLTEQIQSGTITIDGECVQLTKFGKKIVNFSEFYRANFLPKKRLILDSYSNELIKIYSEFNDKIDIFCQSNP